MARKIKFWKSSQAGFTIAENLVSIFLLSFTLTGGMRFYHLSSEMMSLVVHKKMTTQIVDMAMENLKHAGYASLPSAGTAQIQSLQVGRLSGQQSILVTDIDDTGLGTTDYKKVEVTLDWTQGGKNTLRQVKAITYITP